MRDPLPDVASAVITGDDFMEGVDGFATGGVAYETSVSAGFMGCGGVERYQRQSADEGNERDEFFHGGVIYVHAAFDESPRGLFTSAEKI